jgi:hypothetical protein
MHSEFSLTQYAHTYTTELHKEAAQQNLAKEVNKDVQKGLNLSAALTKLLAQVWQPRWTTAVPATSAVRPAARLATTTGEIFPVKL